MPREWALYANLATTAVFMAVGRDLLADLSHPVWFAVVLSWLLLVVLFSAFAVVRHAECLASKLGEPLGTLILTLAVTGIEVMIIVATMSARESPTLAPDGKLHVADVAFK